MKSLEKIYNKKWENVVPYAGAWIEIEKGGRYELLRAVVPYAGTGIEIFMHAYRLTPSIVVPYAGGTD